MNILSQLVTCMYPDMIRTESIESMDHDCRFHAVNIDEQGNEISGGELQITNDDLIYFKPSKFPTRWPLNYIRRYGCIEEGQKFVFEVGRKCETGQAIYAFRVTRGAELVEKLSEKIEHQMAASASTTSSSGGGCLGYGDESHNTGCSSSTSTNRNNNNNVSRKLLSCASSSQRHRSEINSSGFHRHNKDDQPPLNRAGDANVDPRPLSYSFIDHELTKALNESARARQETRAR